MEINFDYLQKICSKQQKINLQDQNIYVCKVLILIAKDILRSNLF